MIDLLASLNWLSIIVATVVYFVLGALWYSPVLFGNIWMKLRNLDKDTMEQPNPIIYLYSFILQFIGVISLALFISALGVSSATHGTLIGFGAGAGFVFSLAGTTGIFTDIPMKLHLLDNGYHVAGLIIAGFILGVW